MSKAQFWRNPSLKNYALEIQPKPVRNLLKIGRENSVPGSGPRTLDSIISYLPSMRTKINKNFDHLNMPKIDFKNKTIKDSNNVENITDYENSINNVIICISQRDFPINIHQRILLLLAYKGIDFNHIQWVITDIDQLKTENNEQITPENVNYYKNKFKIQFHEYFKYFKYDKVLTKLLSHELKRENNDESKIFKTSSEDDKSFHNLVLEKIKNFDVDKDHIHLYSKFYSWTLPPIIQSLETNSNKDVKTFVIGQTNSGKSTLIYQILKHFEDDLQITNFEMLSDYQNVKVDAAPFSSKFEVFNAPGMKLIDTPGYVRHNGGIWSQFNKFGADFLKIEHMNTGLKNQTVKLTPHLFHYSNQTLKKSSPTVLSVSHLIFAKPWIMLTGNENEVKHEIENIETFNLKLKITRNIFGKISKLTDGQLADKVQLKNDSKRFVDPKWKKYLVPGDKFALILDNIGSFEVNVENGSKLQSVYWEVYAPANVSILRRDFIDQNSVKFTRIQETEKKFSRLLGEIYEINKSNEA